jgi:hypothetical protein
LPPVPGTGNSRNFIDVARSSSMNSYTPVTSRIRPLPSNNHHVKSRLVLKIKRPENTGVLTTKYSRIGAGLKVRSFLHSGSEKEISISKDLKGYHATHQVRDAKNFWKAKQITSYIVLMLHARS